MGGPVNVQIGGVLLSPSHRVYVSALAIADLGMLKRCLEEQLMQEPKDRGTGDSGRFICTWGLSSSVCALSFLISRPAIVFSIPLLIRHFKNSLIIHKEKAKGIMSDKATAKLTSNF